MILDGIASSTFDQETSHNNLSDAKTTHVLSPTNELTYTWCPAMMI